MINVCVVKNGSFMDVQNVVGVFSSKEEAVKYIKEHYPSLWNTNPDDWRSNWSFKEVCFNCIDDKNNYIIK